MGPKGVKFKFMQQYLHPKEVHTVGWHLPSYAETKISTSIDLVADYIVGLYKSTGSRWNVVGSSTGALIALHVAYRHPECVHKLLLLSPAIDLLTYFEINSKQYDWSESNPSAVDQFQPNGTGDDSGFLELGFLADLRSLKDSGRAIAPCVPCYVVHAESDELVPVSDVREWCTKYGTNNGGQVHHNLILPSHDREGAVLDHGLYHFAKPDAITECTLEGILNSWFL